MGKIAPELGVLNFSRQVSSATKSPPPVGCARRSGEWQRDAVHAEADRGAGVSSAVQIGGQWPPKGVGKTGAQADSTAISEVFVPFVALRCLFKWFHQHHAHCPHGAVWLAHKSIALPIFCVLGCWLGSHGLVHTLVRNAHFPQEINLPVIYGMHLGDFQTVCGFWSTFLSLHPPYHFHQ